ncbi:3'-5' exoribonuclease domain-containing protein [Streptomyces nigrescens]|uniref:3'-5' exoribonuclease domain-containing protein n=1 Tax=Streptomyces nigrescens TaxID=1920 RepID=UPI0036FCAA87
MAKTRVFYDTEFLEDGKSIELISIGMVRESDGKELYLVNRDMPVKRIRKHPWLNKHVWPSLPRVPDEVRMTLGDRLNYAHPAVQPRAEIAARVRRFITDTPDPQLWAWYGAYDHVALAWLFGPMSDLPNGIPMWTNDIRQEAERLGNPQLPEQPRGEHNALEDARHNMVRARFLDQYAQRTT